MIIPTPVRNQKADQLQDIVFQEIEKVIAPGKRNILSLLRQSFDKPDEVTPWFKNASVEDLRVFNKYYNVLHTVRSYTPILMQREHQAKTNENFDDLETGIRAMVASGYDLKDTLTFLSDIKISKSGTSHPTETLNKAGIRLTRALVTAAETDNPEQEIRSIIQKMVEADNIGANSKDGILDEIDSTTTDSNIHNDGAYILNSFVKDVLIDVFKPFGEDLKLIDGLVLDIGRRSWDYDSDGKNNAEGWAMMAKLSTTTWEALDGLEHVLNEVAFNSTSGLDAETQALFKDLHAVQYRLKPIYERSREIAKKLAEFKSAEEREDYYRRHYKEYTRFEKEFSKIYDKVDQRKRGWGFYNAAVEKIYALQTVLKGHYNQPIIDKLDRVLSLLSMNGFVLEKAQPRQNDLIHAKIIDNLFYHQGFQGRGILSASEIDEIKAAGGFNQLGIERQHELMQVVQKYAADNGNGKELLADLFDANPLSFKSGNGFPDQERTLLDRFKLRSFFPLTFDQGIISDCVELGPYRQKFIADLFGLTKMKHMPLHEDRLNLTRQGDLLADIYNRSSGSIREKIKKLTDLNQKLATFIGGRGIHETHMMRPCSDATKGGGSATAQEAVDVFRQILWNSLRLSEEIGEAVPLEIMLGGGLSGHRYGGSPDIICRVIEQGLKAYAIERAKEGNPLNPRENKEDRRLLRSALAILWTEQGRAKRYMTATPNQIADDYSVYITRMIEGRLDIENAFDEDYNFIQKPTVTNAERAKLSQYHSVAIKAYVDMRHVLGTSNEKVLDSLSAKVTCPNMCKYMNNASRPGSKTIGTDQRTKKRAIENNERDFVSELFLGRYGMGAMMQKIKIDYDDGTLSKDGVHMILDDPEATYNMFNKDLADATRADYNYSLKQLNWDDASFEELVELGRNVTLYSPPGEDQFHLRWQGDYTQDQAYLAKAYYDHVIYVATIEAILNGRFFDQTLGEMVAAVRPTNGVNVKPGPKTEKKFPIAKEIATENDTNTAGTDMIHEVERRIQSHIDSGLSQDDAVEAVGGEAFVRQAASAWRAGTLPHWVLWSGRERCLAHNPNPKQSLASLLEIPLTSLSSDPSKDLR